LTPHVHLGEVANGRRGSLDLTLRARSLLSCGARCAWSRTLRRSVRNDMILGTSPRALTDEAGSRIAPLPVGEGRRASGEEQWVAGEVVFGPHPSPSPKGEGSKTPPFGMSSRGVARAATTKRSPPPVREEIASLGSLRSLRSQRHDTGDLTPARSTMKRAGALPSPQERGPMGFWRGAMGCG
jgi:hypothetical protein